LEVFIFTEHGKSFGGRLWFAATGSGLSESGSTGQDTSEDKIGRRFEHVDWIVTCMNNKPQERQKVLVLVEGMRIEGTFTAQIEFVIFLRKK